MCKDDVDTSEYLYSSRSEKGVDDQTRLKQCQDFPLQSMLRKTADVGAMNPTTYNKSSSEPRAGFLPCFVHSRRCTFQIIPAVKSVTSMGEFIPVTLL